MLLMSRHNNIKDKEVNYVQGRTSQRYRSAFISPTIASNHESFSHGPFFSGASEQRKKRWTLQPTIYQAILMAYEPSASLKNRFIYARQCLVEMFPNRKRPGETYQGLVKAIRKIPSEILEQLQLHLCRMHRKIAGRFWKVSGWIPFATDGSRVETPRTKANQEAFGCAGREKTGPQMLLTALYHLGSGLPWNWAIGSGTDSERGQLRSMLKSLPRCSLLIADAGFTGYDLLKDILSHNLSFLVRVGANVTLLKGLGFECKQRGNIVWLWPTAKRDQKPLKLRLIRLRVKTKLPRIKHDVCLLTNVFDTERLSDEMAGKFYQMRWGIEVFFRSFKRTMDHHKMRSRSPELAKLELHWALTALLLLELMSVDALIIAKRDPMRLSVAGALDTVRFAMRTTQRWRPHGDIRLLLCEAIQDDYERQSSKEARDWARKKKESPPGEPKIRQAKPNEITCYKRIYNVA